MVIVIGGGTIGRALGEALNAFVIEHQEMDVTDYNEVIQRLTGLKIDVLINCAGIYGPIGKFHKNDIEFWKATIEVNLLGTVNVCHAALQAMKKGKIINMSGGGALYPRPRFSAYATSKAGVVRFTETIAKEYPNIQINAVSPGFIRSKMTKNIQKSRKSQDIQKVIKAVKYLLKSKVTGQVIKAQYDF